MKLSPKRKDVKLVALQMLFEAGIDHVSEEMLTNASNYLFAFLDGDSESLFYEDPVQPHFKDNFEDFVTWYFSTHDSTYNKIQDIKNLRLCAKENLAYPSLIGLSEAKNLVEDHWQKSVYDTEQYYLRRS